MIDQAAPSWPYIVGFGVAMGAAGGALKWIHSIKSARTAANARRARLDHLPTRSDVEEAIKQFNRYEQLRAGHLRRIQSRGVNLGRLTEQDEAEADKFARDNVNLSPTAAAMVSDSMFVAGARHREKRNADDWNAWLPRRKIRGWVTRLFGFVVVGFPFVFPFVFGHRDLGRYWLTVVISAALLGAFVAFHFATWERSHRAESECLRLQKHLEGRARMNEREIEELLDRLHIVSEIDPARSR